MKKVYRRILSGITLFFLHPTKAEQIDHTSPVDLAKETIAVCKPGQTVHVESELTSQVEHFFMNIFNTSYYPRRWECGSWSDFQGWLYVVSDLLIFLSYLAIPIVIVLYLLPRKKIRITSLYYLFAAFILLCGFTHLIDAIIFWKPLYGLNGLLKFFTAIISMSTVVALIKVVPSVLELKNPEQYYQEVDNARRALRRADILDDQLRFLYRTVDQGIIYQNEKGAIVEANKRAEEILGLTMDQLNGVSSIDPSWNTIHPDGTDYPGDTHPIVVSLKTGQSVKDAIMGVYVLKLKTYKWIRVNAYPRFDEVNRDAIIGAYAIFSEITEEFESDKKLFLSEKKFASVFNDSFNFIGLIRPDGSIIDLNNTMLKMVGKTRSEVAESSFIHAPWWHGSQKTIERIEKCIKQSSRVVIDRFEIDIRDNLGELLTIDLSIKPIANEKEEIAFFIAEGRDITERVDFQRKIIASEKKLDLFINQAPVAVAMLDRNMNYLATSRKWREDYNILDQEWSGKNHYDLIPAIRNRPDWIAQHKQVLSGEIIDGDKDLLIRSDNMQQWLHRKLFPWYDEFQKIGGIIMYTEDVSTEVQKEKELKGLNTQLVEAQAIASLGSFQYDIETGRLDWSDQMFQVFEVEPHTFTNDYQSFEKCVSQEYIAVINQCVETALADKSSYHVEYEVNTEADNNKTVSERGKIIFDAQGLPKTIKGTIQDVTLEKNLEESLKRNLDLQKTIAEIAIRLNEPTPFSAKMEDTIHAISAALNATGIRIYEDDETSTSCFTSFAWDNVKKNGIRSHAVLEYENNLPKLSEAFDIKNDAVLDNAFELREYLPISNTHSCLMRQLKLGEKRIGFMVLYDCERTRMWQSEEINLFRTITEIVANSYHEHLSSWKLQESEKKYKSLANIINDPYAVFDHKLKYIYWNEASERETGILKEDILGKSYLEVMGNKANQEFHSILKKTLEDGQPRKFYTNYNGKHFDLLIYGGEHQVSVITHDVTKRVLLQESLESSMKMYETLYHHTPAMMHSVDENFNIINVSDFWLEKMGYTREEVIGQKALTFLTEQSRIESAQYTEEFQNNGVLKDIDYVLLDKNGDEIHVLLNAIAEYDTNHKFVRSLSVFIDVTAERKAQEEIERLNITLEEKVIVRTEKLNNTTKELEEQKNLLQAIFDNSSAGMFLKDLEGTFLMANAVTLKGMGMTLEQWQGHNDFDFFPAIVANSFREHELEVIETKTLITREEMQILKDERVDTLVSKFPLLDSDGEPYAICGLITDVTELKSKQREIEAQAKELELLSQELANQKSLLQSVFDNADIKVYIKNLEGKYIYANNQYFKNLGFKRELDLLDKTDFDFYEPDRAMEISVLDQKAIEEGKLIKNEEVFGDSDKEVHLVTRFPLFTSKGETYAVCTLSTNISQIKQQQYRLEQQAEELISANELLRQNEVSLHKSKKELEEINAELESFSYSVSHDLRAPLRALEGFSSLLMSDYTDVLDSQGQKWLGFINENSLKMDALINDMLSFSKVTRGRFEKRPVDMLAMVKEIVAQEQLHYKDHEVKVNIGQLPPAPVDHTIFKQVWVNLISNAFKYSSKNDCIKIEIDGKVDGELAYYSISDNGVGFNTDYKDRLFNVFQRLHQEKDFSGTGVGLAIVKKIVKKHGGEISARSNEGSGATFEFSLPL